MNCACYHSVLFSRVSVLCEYIYQLRSLKFVNGFQKFQYVKSLCDKHGIRYMRVANIHI